MKKIAAAAMAALIGLTLLAGMAQAQSRTSAEQKIERQSAPNQQIKKRQWKKGGKYGGQGSAVSDHRQHNLKAPPKGHRWVRDGNDFILVAIGTGIIASITSNTGR
ncbi:RcnB family protein [Mesorhizobium sp. SB112]|uniref:RcnB family protein n=1 Tax=Mesorhizobium sp. SB112 TaxID=3151853 RepID=UPI003267512A